MEKQSSPVHSASDGVLKSPQRAVGFKVETTTLSGTFSGLDDTPLNTPVATPSEFKVRTIADRLGICLSALCVVHCLLTPVLLILIPTLEVSAYHDLFHEGLLMILPLLALAAFIPGYRRHRDARVFAWGVPGLFAVAVGALIFHDNVYPQVAFSVAGSLLLIRAHLINRKLCACCETGHGTRPRGKGFRRFKKFQSKRAERLLSVPRS